MKKLLTSLLTILVSLSTVNFVYADNTGKTDFVYTVDGEYEWSVPSSTMDLTSTSMTGTVEVTKALLEEYELLQISIDGGNNYMESEATGKGSNLKYNMKHNTAVDYYVSYSIIQDETNSNVGDTTNPATLKTGEISKDDILISIPAGQTTIDGTLVVPVKEALSFTKTGNASLKGDFKDKLTFTAKVQSLFKIHRDINDTSTAWIRDDNLQDVTVQASVNGAGYHSDFDNLPIYKDIKRVIIDSTGNELEYTSDNLSLGDVMVKIPKFYYKRYRDGEDNKTEHIEISPIAQSGFKLHPAFLRNDLDGTPHELPCIYVAAYKTGANHVSKTNTAPLANITRAAFRQGARGKKNADGDGWSIIDLSAYSAIQMLILVEYANNDVQTVIGPGYTNSSNTVALNTGLCDTMYSSGQLSGYPSGSASNRVDVLWRGIEGFWGNVWEFTDGLNFNGGTYYICNDIFKYADDTATNYTALSYTAATNWSESYIKEEGLDTSNSWAMMPSSVGGSASTYYADPVWSSTGWRVLERGRHWNGADGVGLFSVSVGDASSRTNAPKGSRLLYIPLP